MISDQILSDFVFFILTAGNLNSVKLETMANIKDLVTDAQVESLHCVVETGSGKFVCYSRLAVDAWVVGATDGCDLWRLELDMDDLDSQRDLSDVSSLDAYLAKLRWGDQ